MGIASSRACTPGSARLAQRRATHMSTGAIIVAAGRSARMGGDDKLLAQVGGRPLLSWTLAPFLAAASVDEIVVAASPANFMALVDLAHQEAKVGKIVRGG